MEITGYVFVVLIAFVVLGVLVLGVREVPGFRRYLRMRKM